MPKRNRLGTPSIPDDLVTEAEWQRILVEQGVIKPSDGEPTGKNGKATSGLFEKYGQRLLDAVSKYHESQERALPQTQRKLEPIDRLLKLLLVDSQPPGFPLQVFPSLIRRYIEASARSIHCPPDLLAVPLLAVAGAATGRSGRRLRVKPGWIVSSCLWTVGLTLSSGGKTPALNAILSFYDDRQEIEDSAYQDAKEAYEEDPENNPNPGPYPNGTSILS